jgi:outer membrane assembly lipoprotein YfiO
VQERSPGSRLAARAGKELADAYYRQGRMVIAGEAYSIFLENYPTSRWAEYAYERQISASLASFKGPRFDATGLFDAERRLVEYQQAFPGAAEAHGATEALVRIDESLATKSLVVADWYERTGQKISAAYMYSRVVTDHPNSAAAIEALARLARLDSKLADRVAERAPRLRPKGQVSPQTVPEARPETDREQPPVEIEAPIIERPDMREAQ